jgi:hypothetical protein
MTAFVGKLYFKSGASQRENLLQTPTAVCALRGSIANFGFAEGQSLLDLIQGTLEKHGDWVDGAFNLPGLDAATRNGIWAQINEAQKMLESGDQANAELAIAELAVLVGEALKNNPDPAVRQDGEDLIEQGRKARQAVIDRNPVMTTTTTVFTTTTTAFPTVETTEETTSTVEATTSVPSTSSVAITIPTSHATSSIPSW